MQILPSVPPDFRRRDYSLRPFSAVLLWGVPVGTIVLASVFYSIGSLPPRPAAALFTLATVWIGVGCLLNARACGRTHCLIVAGGFLPLSAVGAANVLGYLSFSWDPHGVYWLAFTVILVAAFATEFCWTPYYERASAASSSAR